MEEYFVVVGHEDTMEKQGSIVPYGCVARNLAHSPARIPHATVQIIPVRCGTRRVFIHRRSDKVRIAPGAWDIFGGHVAFELGILSSPSGLADVSLATALREAREEVPVSVGGSAQLILQADLKQVGAVGQFTCDEPNNVEYSTLYVLRIPSDAKVGDSPFELRDGTVEFLPVREIEWDELLETFRKRKKCEFADGISRVLKHALISSDIESAIGHC